MNQHLRLRMFINSFNAMKVVWRNIFENPAAVQFNHRLFGTATALAIAWLLFRCLRLNTTAAARTAAYSLSALVILQFSLGVLVLTNGVPHNLAVAHQLVGVCLFINSLILIRLLRVPESSIDAAQYWLLGK